MKHISIDFRHIHEDSIEREKCDKWMQNDDIIKKEKMPPIIEIDGLRKIYKIGNEKVVALDNISLSIQKGEICCLLGTSGSGKSTLLNMIAGLEKPTKGSIKINDHYIERMNEKKLAAFRQSTMGFIFQAYHLLPALTAVENVALPLTFKRVKKAERVARAKKMLELVGLKSHMNHKPTQMSGGQQQRVGIARAFVATPAVMLADEPTGNLDSKTTKEVMTMMVDMIRKNGQTMLIVTHDHDVALYADRIIHILDGRIDYIEIVRDGQVVKTINCTVETE